MDLERRLDRAVAGTVGEVVTTTTLYVLAAGILWIAFYVLLRRRVEHRKIGPKHPDWPQVRRETLHSLRSILVFGSVTFVVLIAAGYGLTQLYGKVEKYGWWWLPVSFALAVLLHDMYFYWTHRLMHHPRLFRRLHRTHHLSISPTPWAAYAFGVGEAVVQAGIGPLVVCLIPMHGLVFLAFMTWQIVWNVFGHLGYEIYPRWFLRTWVGKLVNTPTHHGLHHERFRGNYGLYFNVWDRLMGTNLPEYPARFEKAAGGSKTLAA
ncbi:Fatty acid hydroxylase superfamily protein [Gemmata obscuriglobus]|uniref:Sterol desaturase family protein n=1 Tax=Gemmata obscuriglobus TaxID=114 RepID=A0A2Z3H5X5_9BACT|nr:sterol desaturase family protein [Gemmata obscuriglobus]AWM37044.1 sterol desaturase family protein [Gemmata obscuriglobus]QEG30247.1 Fatty acid hydroxylase superfamily protein [Gemmata obscuriglobus]VTS09571.1 sterol desaturase : C-5 sterol desaturase OS=Leptonema illini DSM 21528 GN=Lepil_2178 PE=4 SV=1: FA_hydroxylase [Gemmata obscuriglobus UQM 2246]